MLTALNKNGEKVAGWKADRGDVYYCPSCEEELILRQGEVKVHHFSHITETKCPYTSGETEEHLLMKKFLYQEFQKSGLYKQVEIEYRIGDKIADVFVESARNKKIAIECQIQDMDISEFRKKTAYYSYQGVYVLWIFSENKELDKLLLKLVHTKDSRLNYNSGEVERKCHRWYYGRIYYLYVGKIYAIHFYPDEKWFPSSCDECLDEPRCAYKNPAECPKYRVGYMGRSKTKREISIYEVHPSYSGANNMKLMCVDREDRLRIAKFNEPAWWKI